MERSTEVAGTSADWRPTVASARYELKLACQEEARHRVRMALRLHPAGLVRQHPARRVQSVYLDTGTQRALAENEAGISRREKLRLRWYGEGAGRVRGQLELKLRENTLGWKRSVPLAEELDVEGTERRAFVENLARLVPPAWSTRLRQGLEPAQWISYAREYLVTADRRVRVTLDTRIVACDLRLRRRLSRSHPTPLPRLLVVEVKCAVADLDRARDVVGRLPVPVDRCSKFVLASDPGHGPHPSLA